MSDSRLEHKQLELDLSKSNGEPISCLAAEVLRALHLSRSEVVPYLKSIFEASPGHEIVRMMFGSDDESTEAVSVIHSIVEDQPPLALRELAAACRSHSDFFLHAFLPRSDDHRWIEDRVC